MMLRAYRVVTILGAPLIRLYLAWRKALGKEDRARFGERLGRPGRPRPDGPLVWLHAASVGESISMLPLIERLPAYKPGLSVLVTTGTVTSAKLMIERLPKGAFHQYIPVDRPSYVRRFLDHWRPDLALWAESEFWPNLISGTAGRGIPMILINGRISPRSYIGWQRGKSLINRLLSSFTLCLGQTEDDVGRLLSLGAGTAKCLGNIKFAASPLPVDEAELSRMEAVIKGRPRWLAASTHPGEEEIVGRVHGKLKSRCPDLLSIIAPRHPQRGGEIAEALRAAGFTVALRSRLDEINKDIDIYVADTLGELGLFYRLCDVVFIGKSMTPSGGQNPLEAARLNCAVIHGPHMANFDEIARSLKQAGGSVEAADEAELAAQVEKLLGSGNERIILSQAAMAFAGAGTGVLDLVMAELTPFLDRMEDRHAGA
ncbi:MAG: 3-deoxy-D-manno-octulosonic acid transferase [Rhodospirillales bacterium RIFCSPLOWO2_02_FULL_58_16]|nr:MAG: 3-deoxy-D-manno-octulosonic acid transferase [Rhodospirillales bacterium RIFCSPLOWO2_02_FULL_58_16]